MNLILQKTLTNNLTKLSKYFILQDSKRLRTFQVPQ